MRPGLMAYGLSPLESGEGEGAGDVMPALRWETAVAVVREFPAGSALSYNRTFVTSRESKIALLPVGYGDGYPRAASGKAHVLIGGRRVPIVGTITMDLILADVTDITDGGGVEEGDEVILIGKQFGEHISADELAGWAGTISYEIFTGITSRVPRVFVD